MIGPWFRAAALTFSVSLSLGAAEHRVALVIGNGNYDGDAKLKNPANDAAAVTKALRGLQFTVTEKTNLNQREFKDAVAEFSETLTKESVAIFFFAGHGLQMSGENYLVPIKANLKIASDVEDNCCRLKYVLDGMEEGDARLKVVVLDCCRDEPFTRSFKATRGDAGGRGLTAPTRVPRGTIIAFSTAPGETAADGKGLNSPYSKHFVHQLSQRPKDRGLEIKDVFFDTGAAVEEEIGQSPWMNIQASIPKYYLWRRPGGEVVDQGGPPVVDGSSSSGTRPPPVDPTEKLVKELASIDLDRKVTLEAKGKLSAAQKEERKLLEEIKAGLMKKEYPPGRPLLTTRDSERWIQERDRLLNRLDPPVAEFDSRLTALDSRRTKVVKDLEAARARPSAP